MANLSFANAQFSELLKVKSPPKLSATSLSSLGEHFPSTLEEDSDSYIEDLVAVKKNEASKAKEKFWNTKFSLKATKWGHADRIDNDINVRQSSYEIPKNWKKTNGHGRVMGRPRVTSTWGKITNNTPCTLEYDVNNKINQSTPPIYSMTFRRNNLDKVNEKNDLKVPFISDYIKPKPETNSWKLPLYGGDRIPVPVSEAPGPGKYEIKDKVLSDNKEPLSCIMTQRRDPNPRATVEPISLVVSRKYNLEAKSIRFPGPGQYQLQNDPRVSRRNISIAGQLPVLEFRSSKKRIYVYDPQAGDDRRGHEER
jgi:hypothetical protein